MQSLWFSTISKEDPVCLKYWNTQLINWLVWEGAFWAGKFTLFLEAAYESTRLFFKHSPDVDPVSLLLSWRTNHCRDRHDAEINGRSLAHPAVEELQSRNLPSCSSRKSYLSKQACASSEIRSLLSKMATDIFEMLSTLPFSEGNFDLPSSNQRCQWKMPHL